MKNLIRKLRVLFNTHSIDGYIIPKNDEFFSEHANKDRLKKITNFTGSAGNAIILKNKNYYRAKIILIFMSLKFHFIFFLVLKF